MIAGITWLGHDRTKDDPEFQNGYWQDLYAWYHDRGMRHVAAFLMQRDIPGSTPKRRRRRRRHSGR